MKILIKSLFVVVGVFLVASSATLKQAAPIDTTGVSSSAAVGPSAETLFKQHCSKCHGTDGSGTSMGRMFNVPNFTDSEWWAAHSNTAEHIQTITDGKGHMPSFGKKLTRARIASLAIYIKRFGVKNEK